MADTYTTTTEAHLQLTQDGEIQREPNERDDSSHYIGTGLSVWYPVSRHYRGLSAYNVYGGFGYGQQIGALEIQVLTLKIDHCRHSDSTYYGRNSQPRSSGLVWFRILPDIGYLSIDFEQIIQVLGSEACLSLAAGILFEIGSLICGVAPNSTAVIVDRAITGWGAAGLVGSCYTRQVWPARYLEGHLPIAPLGDSASTLTFLLEAFHWQFSLCSSVLRPMHAPLPPLSEKSSNSLTCLGQH
ncbi:hypothetical protein N7445_005966 [Penicillium cf. griseofulvum]|nr:hypothetical protein N7445_005966 [Penicillium cf. griseofulvum]